ncbi:MAG: creatininase family protein [Candidatus Melainabacteria bacterium]|nr:creatininase family protein [Candidatus Melainabacteria bacterium]
MNLQAKIQELVESPERFLDPAHNEYLLANKSSPEIAEYLKKDQRVILPLGSTEQHGPDGILGIDHITATGIAYAVAQLTGVLCAPPLNYGMAMHHLGFPGTMALRPTTYINLICDLIHSLKRHGFKKVIVINGHGGNKGPFMNALAEREDEFAEMDFSFVNWWVMPGLQKNIIDKYFAEKEGYHATPTEISVTMALVPEAMTMPDSYTCPQAQVDNDNCAWVMPGKFREYYPDGVMRADYSGSTQQIGKETLAYALTEICELI